MRGIPRAPSPRRSGSPCRAGVCSTCRAKLLSGTVTMANNVALEDWELEAGFVLCCQSRPTSRELELSYDEK